MDQLIAAIQDMLAFDGALLTAALIAAVGLVTASLVAAGTPGVLIPATLAAEALAGPVAATATVSMGAMGGSLLLFAAARRWGSPVLSRHLGSDNGRAPGHYFPRRADGENKRVLNRLLAFNRDVEVGSGAAGIR